MAGLRTFRAAERVDLVTSRASDDQSIDFTSTDGPKGLLGFSEALIFLSYSGWSSRQVTLLRLAVIGRGLCF